MQRGLDGRRVAVYVGSLTNKAGAGIQQALEQAGARVHVLTDEAQQDDFHGGVYAALVVVSAASANAPIVQLVREFLASDKPVAAFGDAVPLIVAAGGAAGRKVAADGGSSADLHAAGATTSDRAIEIDEALITATVRGDPREFAEAIVRQFSERLDERAVDEMSE